ncbi:MAG: DJ-1/PfpI family protein [Candidatus Omnitrophica bacterium]|nr:DJ-1/PfpI family protein [Candidatus Omnitrophota bacterium]
MKRVLVPLAPGFEEIEAVTVIDVLRRAGVEVVVAGTAAGPIRGSQGISMAADRPLDQAEPASFDMIVFPGGGVGVENLKAHPRILPLIGEFTARGKWIGAICAAPSLLGQAGLLCGKQVTSHPCVKEEVAPSSLYSEERVVVDGKLVTSRGPGTAMEFALKLVEMLVGVEKVSELKAAMLAA